MTYDLDDAVRNMIRRGTIQSIDDSGSQQMVKGARGLGGEELSDCYRAQGHGLSSVPPEGSEGLLLSMGGRADRTLLLGFEHKEHRPKDQKPGWTTLYDAGGNVVSMVGQGGIKVRSKDGDVTVDVPASAKVFMGGDGKSGSYQRVRTEAGVSVNLWARVG